MSTPAGRPQPAPLFTPATAAERERPGQAPPESSFGQGPAAPPARPREPADPTRWRRSTTSLAGRITAACLVVAVVAVGAAGLVAVRLVAVTARTVTQDVLAQQANVVAAQLAETGGGLRGGAGMRRVVDVLAGQGVTVVVVTARGARNPGVLGPVLQQAGVDRALGGQPVSAQVVSGESATWCEADRLDRLVGDLMEHPAGVGGVVPGDDTRADPRRLRQVVDGLAENALRVTPRGAPLVVATGGDATVSWLQVRDGGPGFAPEDYPVVFERGVLHDRYRGRRPVGSGGVGLALVHGLVVRMGAVVAAAPAPEGGACFTVTFPVADRGVRR